MRITMPPLALALALGCGDLNKCVGTVAECGTDTGDLVAQTATLHLKAPYEWVGDWWVMWDEDTDTEEVTEHFATSECEVEVRAPGNGRVDLWGGDRFMCVIQDITVPAEQAGTIVEVVEQWTGDGMCGLAPEGEYGVWKVDTRIASLNGFDQVTIYLGTWESIVTGNTFFFEEEDDYLLEGTIADDLSSITYHLAAGSQSEDATINLED